MAAVDTTGGCLGLLKALRGGGLNVGTAAGVLTGVPKVLGGEGVGGDG